MKQVIATEQKPIKLWLDDIEGGALAQARNLANLPFTYKHVAIMPDAHQGYGMPIGGVLATEQVVIPNGVGVDIGCGMCAVKTSLETIEGDALKQILGSSKKRSGIRATIPVGFSHQKKAQSEQLMPDCTKVEKLKRSIALDHFRAAQKQIGTLGGGNHFIEIQEGNDGHVWLMIHSGSRNIGLQVAKHYNQMAIKLNARWKSAVPRGWDLAFLSLDSGEGWDYLAEMQFCVDFALANRKLMMERVKEAVLEVAPDTTFEPVMNVAHNYAALETHFGREVVVHRKGATKAAAGEYGIIPGSQGSCSYIVVGRGNPDSFNSCSHGAGRLMGRKQAQRTLDLAVEQKKLDDLGVLHALRSKRDLDEAAGAYKDINTVMANQEDLVDIHVRLKPLAVVKG